jgi:hypothetical protein
VGNSEYVAEMLQAVSSCLQLLIAKTDVCGGQTQEMGGEEECPLPQSPHAENYKIQTPPAIVLQPLASSLFPGGEGKYMTVTA